MFILKLNSKGVFQYPFDSGKKLSLSECFEKKQNHTFSACLDTADLISISVSPTKGLHFIIIKK